MKRLIHKCSNFMVATESGHVGWGDTEWEHNTWESSEQHLYALCNQHTWRESSADRPTRLVSRSWISEGEVEDLKFTVPHDPTLPETMHFLICLWGCSWTAHLFLRWPFGYTLQTTKILAWLSRCSQQQKHHCCQYGISFWFVQGLTVGRTWGCGCDCTQLHVAFLLAVGWEYSHLKILRWRNVKLLALYSHLCLYKSVFTTLKATTRLSNATVTSEETICHASYLQLTKISVTCSASLRQMWPLWPARLS